MLTAAPEKGGIIEALGLSASWDSARVAMTLCLSHEVETTRVPTRCERQKSELFQFAQELFHRGKSARGAPLSQSMRVRSASTDGCRIKITGAEGRRRLRQLSLRY